MPATSRTAPATAAIIERHDEISLQALEGGFPPGQQRTCAGQEKQQQAHGDRRLVEERSAHRDAHILHGFRNQREQRSPEDCKDQRQQNPIVEEKAAFAGNHGIELVLALEMIEAKEKQRNREENNDAKEDREKRADVRLCEGVDGRDNAASGEKRTEDAQEETL